MLPAPSRVKDSIGVWEHINNN
ncbi:protein of unknown function [Shewanella benthica]|uniref:Uncharacterized protein n=1 Tax=Shewanella benthica TaxID=43661 RepID=A0A330M3N4_9GAMM|nr:protein of unknown function [Shewanella benthica]